MKLVIRLCMILCIILVPHDKNVQTATLPTALDLFFIIRTQFPPQKKSYKAKITVTDRENLHCDARSWYQ